MPPPAPYSVRKRLQEGDAQPDSGRGKRGRGAGVGAGGERGERGGRGRGGKRGGRGGRGRGYGLPPFPHRSTMQNAREMNRNLEKLHMQRPE